jgi:DNA helicase-2/ATP-dependent DNA helicase PcrA
MSSATRDDYAPAYLLASRELRKNEQQWKAYQSKGHCVVLAGPGSGKTKVLTVKLSRLLAENVSPPRGVACVTYNNECARELVRRLRRLGVRSTRNVFVGTVHSFCLKAILLPYARLAGLGLSDPVHVAHSEQQERALAAALGREISVNERPSDWKLRCDRYRRTYLDRDAPEWLDQDEQAARVIAAYEAILHERGMIDFDDMVLMGLRLVESCDWVRKALQARFPVLVVDEYQDLGLPLHRLVLSLCFGNGANCRLFAVGDPDQSIYGFTGAMPELLLELSRDERVESVHLRLNYRSRASIVTASEVALGEERGYKAVSGDGGIIDFHECRDGLRQQAEMVCDQLIPTALAEKAARNIGEIAVLYRDKFVGDVIADCAAAYNLAFIRIDGNAPYPRTPLTRWLEECAAWCSGAWRTGDPPLSGLLHQWTAFNGHTHQSHAERLRKRRMLVKFLFSHRTRSMPVKQWLLELEESCLRETFQRETTLSDEAHAFGKLLVACSEGKKLSEWTLIQFGGQGGSPDHLNLMTLHSAKGLEFDVVSMLGMDQGIIPSYRETSPQSKREPRRLFYVGLTRARFEVHMMYSGWRETPWGARREDGPSEFLIEVQRALAAGQ